MTLVAKPRKRPGQKRSKLTFNSILIAAAKIIEKGGLKKFNTNNIAQVAGVSVGTLYQYFPSKESVLVELVNHYFKEQDAKMIEYFRNNKLNVNDIDKSIDEVLNIFYKIIFEPPQISRILLQQIESLKLKEMLKKLDETMAVEIKLFIDKHNIGKEASLDEIKLFLAATKAINDLYLGNKDTIQKESPKKLIHALMKNILE